MTATYPEVATTFQIAAFRRRFTARTLDFTACFAIGMFLNAVFWGDPFPDEPHVGPGSSAADLVEVSISLTLGGLVLAIYDGLSTASSAWKGQTPGKRLLRVRVTATDGSALRRTQAWRRAACVALLIVGPQIAGHLLDAATGATPAFSDIGTLYVPLVLLPSIVLLGLHGDWRQTLYDRWSSTIVIEAGGDPQSADPPDSGPLVFAQPAVAPTREIRGRARTAGTWGLVTATAASWALYAALATGLVAS